MQYGLFCREYLACRNATRAAIAAGYSPRSAYAQGSRLLKNAEVQREIARLRAEAAERNNLTVDAVLSRLKDTHDAAMAAGDFMAGVRALDLIGQALGMFPGDGRTLRRSR